MIFHEKNKSNRTIFNYTDFVQSKIDPIVVKFHIDFILINSKLN